MNGEATALWAAGNDIRRSAAARTKQIEDTLHLVALYNKNVHSGLPSVVTNDPASLFWMAVAVLSDGTPRDSVLVGGQPEDVQVLAGKAERGLAALWHTRDTEAVWDGHEPWLRELAFWMCTGYYYVTAWMHKRPDGSAHPVSDVLSPLETFHVPGAEGYGPAKVVRVYRTTVQQARDIAQMFGGDASFLGGDGNERITVMNLWERDDKGVTYSIMAQGRTLDFIVPPYDTGESRIPVIGGAVAGAPGTEAQYTTGDIRNLDFDVDVNALPRPGVGILDANKPVYEALDEFYTTYARIADQYRRALWLIRGLGIDIEPGDLSGKGSGSGEGLEGKIVQTANPQASILRIDPGRSPFEIREMIDKLEQMAQRGGLPYALFAQAQDLSGFALDRLLSAVSHRLRPYRLRMEFLRGVVGEGWLSAYRDGGYVDLSVRVREQHATEKFSAKDVPETFTVESTVPLALPSDLAERVNMARLSVPNQPLMSLRHAQEEFKLVDDPDLDREQQRDERLAQNPLVAQGIDMIAAASRKAAAYRKEGREDLAVLMDMVRDMSIRLMEQTAGAAPQGAAPGRATPGVPPEVLPLEAQGRSPDAARAMMRQAPTMRSA